MSQYSPNSFLDEVKHEAEFMLFRITLCSQREMNIQCSIAKKILYYCFTLKCIIQKKTYLIFIHGKLEKAKRTTQKPQQNPG